MNPLYFISCKLSIPKIACILLINILFVNTLQGQNCADNSVYVTPGGTGLGSQFSPANLLTAISICKKDTSKHLIKLSTGTYTIYQTIFVPSNVTIDGNYDVTNGIWKKSEVSNCTLSIHPESEEAKTLTSDNKSVTVGHYIGIKLDSVKNITLRDFTLEVHKKNSYYEDMTSDGDGKSVYGIFGQKSQNIFLVNLHIITDSGGEGLYGYDGLDGAEAYYYMPGKTVFDPSVNTSYRPRPSESLLASYEFRAGGASGAGGRLQSYYRCLDCISTVTSTSTYCALEYPLPTGGTGGKNGGAGGSCGEGCQMDCYYEYYKSKAVIKDELKDLLNIPGSSLKDPNPKQGEDGSDGTGIYNGPDYTNQTILPYDDMNYYYIPGMGEKGGDGAGGGGGGGGGAGGIRTLGLVPTVPGLGDYNLPAKALGLVNKAITLAGGDDVCNAEIVNGSTEGGSGGAGGEGGEGGGGGHGGGASIGVFTLLCPNVVDNNCTYTIGEGGRGGSGGLGGNGGNGGLGLSGRPVSDGGWSFQGATGGKGGKGGDGSRGQHGSNGRSITKIGVSLNPSPFMMSDVTTGCTNSLISIYTTGGGFLYNTNTGSSNDVNLVKNTPTGSSYTPFMSYVQVAATDTGMLAVGFSHPQLFPDQKSTVRINTARSLPALNFPSILCVGDTLKLTIDSANAYSWKIYNANNEVIFTSTKQNATYIPVATGTYTVGYQAYDICCGFSVPQYKSFKVSKADKPIVVKINNDVPYCMGTDSTQLKITSIMQFGDKVKWTNGATSAITYVKNPGWNSVTLTNSDGCKATSDSLENQVFSLPTGKPGISDINNVCSFQDLTLYPLDNDPSIIYNFYSQPTSKTVGFLLNGQNQHYLTVTPIFGINDSISYYVRKVNTYYLGRNNYAIHCISDEVKEVKAYKEKYPPVIVSDNVNHDISSSSATCGTIYTYPYPKAEDNCSPNITTQVRYKDPINHYHIGLNTDTIRYIDMSGNKLDYAINITVHDITPPVIYSQPALSNKDLTTDPGKCTSYYPFALAKALDNCTTMPELTGVVPQYIATKGKGYSSVYFIGHTEKDSLFELGTTTIHQAWSDSTGNVTTYEQTINVKDIEAPVLQCSDIIYYVNAGENSAFTGYNAPIATDNCSTSLASSFVSGFGQFGQHPIGTTQEKWQATDASGNTGYCTFNLTVKDTIAPSIDCRNITASASTIAGTDSAQVTFSMPSALDNSGNVTVSTTEAGSGAYYKLGIHNVLYTAIDSSGNKASCYVAVSVFDNQGPAITCPSNITVANDNGLCGAIVNFTIADALDNDGSYYTPFNIMGLAGGSVFPVGITTQGYRVNDAAGNSSFCTFTVTVKDTEAPVFTDCPGNITQNVNPLICGQMITLTTPTATDNSCASPSTGFFSGSSAGFFPVGVTHQVYSSRDIYGNTATCEYDVTIVDNTTLSITCPPDVEVSTTPGLCGAVPSIQFPRANLDYGCIEWKVLSVNGIGDLFIPGEHTVTYQATALGQTATCFFKVTVNDNEPPVIAHPDNIVVYIDPGTCGKAVTFTEPLATDNCSGSLNTLRASGLASGSIFPIGTTKQKYITFDILNVDSAVFTITVLDTIAPSFTDLTDISETTSDMCGKVIYFPTPVATDNSSCFTVTQLSGLNSGDLFPIGITTQTYLVKDVAGNTDTSRFHINVTGNPDAAFYNCPADVVVPSDNGMTKVVWYDVPGHNSCAGVTSLLLSGKGSGATFPAGTNYETYLLTDASGRTDTCTFMVIVTELNPPYIICSEPYQFDLVDSICGAWVKFPVPEVDDFGGSGLDTIFNDLGPTDSLVFVPVGYSQILWTAVDRSGNRGFCTNQIMVGKDEKPENPINSHLQICEGSNLEIYPDMSGEGPYIYEWSYYDTSIPGYALISSDSIFRISSVKESDEMQYVYRVISPCNYTIYQREFFLEVNPAPSVTISGLNTGYCGYDSLGKALSLTPTGGVLVGKGLVNEKFYPHLAGVGMHILSYVYYDSTLACPGTAIQDVNVYATPTVAAFIDTAYCINNLPIQLDSVNSTYSGPGISGTTFSPVLANGGSHVLTRTVTVNGCINTGKQTVRIQGNVPDASILSAGPFCSNQSLEKLEAASNGGIWSGSNLYTDSNSVIYFNVQAAGIGQSKIYYTITEDVCTAKDSATIEVNSSDYLLPYNFDAYCYDQGPVTLDVSDNKNYFGYGIENNVFDPAAYDTTTTALYGVVTLNSNGCKDTVFRAMAVLKPEIANPKKAICGTGDEVALYVDTAFVYVKWFDNSTGDTVWVSATGDYTVELHNGIGCINTDSFMVFTKQEALPPLINNTRELYKCVNTSVDLNVINGYTVSSWSTGASGNMITVNSPGSYRVYIKDTADCELHDSIVVKDYSAIQNNILQNNDTYLEAIESNSYQWYKDSVLLQDASSQTLTLTESGNYYVTLIDSNGCVSNSDVIKVTLTSVLGGEEAELLIYPNPSKGKFIVELRGLSGENFEIVIFDAWGKQVQKLNMEGQSGILVNALNLEDQPSGIYWAQILLRDHVQVVKLVKAE